MIKNRTTIAAFVGTHLLFIFLHIHKSNLFVKESYRKQNNAALAKQLEHSKQELLCKLNAEQNRVAIKTFAQNTLGMKAINLNQIHKISL